GVQALVREEGIFAGISSGAVLYGCQRVADQLDRGDVVGLLPDGGWKYLSTGVWTKELQAAEEALEGRSMWCRLEAPRRGAACCARGSWPGGTASARIGWR